jgi:hypothetical protein
MLRHYVKEGRLDLDGVGKLINHKKVIHVGVTKLSEQLPAGKTHRKVYAKIIHVKKYDGVGNVTFTRGRGPAKMFQNKSVDASYNRMIICW